MSVCALTEHLITDQLTLRPQSDATAIKGEGLMKEKAVASEEGKIESKVKQSDTDDEKQSKKPSRTVPIWDGKEDESHVDRPIKRLFDMWEAYNKGIFPIDNETEVGKVAEAHRILYRGDSHPSVAVLQEAYRQREDVGVDECTITDAWLQFETRASGSKDNVRMDYTNHAAMFDERFKP